MESLTLTLCLCEELVHLRLEQLPRNTISHSSLKTSRQFDRRQTNPVNCFPLFSWKAQPKSTDTAFAGQSHESRKDMCVITCTNDSRSPVSTLMMAASDRAKSKLGFCVPPSNSTQDCLCALSAHMMADPGALCTFLICQFLAFSRFEQPIQFFSSKRLMRLRVEIRQRQMTHHAWSGHFLCNPRPWEVQACHGSLQ